MKPAAGFCIHTNRNSEWEVLLMKIKDFERISPENMGLHLSDEKVCPSVANWPDDEFALWVASHRKAVKDVLCNSSRFKNMSVCSVS